MGLASYTLLALVVIGALTRAADETVLDNLAVQLQLSSSIWPTPCIQYCQNWTGVTVVADGGGWNVTDIDLTDRGINVLFPENLFNSLPNLELLVLNGNNFTGCGWTDMTRFPKLDTFRLKGWKQGDASTLCPLPQFWTVPTLTIFNVESGNMMGILPVTPWQCTKLLNLNLRSNQLMGGIPWDTLTSVTTLERVLLSGNSFSTHDFSSMLGIGNLRNLYEVDVDTLTGGLPGAMSLVSLNLSLETLSFANANLNGSLSGQWPTFPLFGPLQSLDMSGNPSLGAGSTLAKNSLRCNLSGSLENLNLSTTQGDGDTIPQCITQDFKKLESLDISNMNLTGAYPTLKKLKSLTTLRLGRNSFTGAIPFQWGGLPLATIDVADMLTPIQLPLPAALAAAQATLVSVNLHNTGLNGQLQNFLLTIPDVDLTGNPGLKNCSILGGTNICGNSSNVRLDVGQCITFCPPVTGCPFPPPVVIPLPVCNGTAWIIGNVNNTGVTTVNTSAPLEIISDYTQDSTATLEVIVDGSGTVPILVNGDASLDGSLVVVLSEALTQPILIPIITAETVSGNFTSVQVLGDCVLTSEPIATDTGFAVLVTPDTSGACSGSSSKELGTGAKIGIIVGCIGAALIVLIILSILKAKGKARCLFDWSSKRDDKNYIL